MAVRMSLISKYLLDVKFGGGYNVIHFPFKKIQAIPSVYI